MLWEVKFGSQNSQGISKIYEKYVFMPTKLSKQQKQSIYLQQNIRQNLFHEMSSQM